MDGVVVGYLRRHWLISAAQVDNKGCNGLHHEDYHDACATHQHFPLLLLFDYSPQSPSMRDLDMAPCGAGSNNFPWSARFLKRLERRERVGACRLRKMSGIRSCRVGNLDRGCDPVGDSARGNGGGWYRECASPLQHPESVVSEAKPSETTGGSTDGGIRPSGM